MDTSIAEHATKKGMPANFTLNLLEQPLASRDMMARLGHEHERRARRRVGGMIIRVFSARLKPGAREAYEDLCQRVSAPLMSAQPGFLTWRMGAERPGRPDDFVFISLWRDLASLKAFTGEEWEAASIVPGEA